MIVSITTEGYKTHYEVFVSDSRKGRIKTKKIILVSIYMSTDTLSKFVVLLISLYFIPEPGGGATAALNRAKILQKTGLHVFVICGFPSYPKGKLIDSKYKGKFFTVENTDDITVIRLRVAQLEHDGYIKRFIIFMSFILSSLIFMPKIMKVTGKIDISYSLAPIMFGAIIGYIYSKINRSLFVYDVPDLWPEELATFESPYSHLIVFIGERLSKILYNSANVIITISDSAAEIIKKNYYPNTPIFSIPIGVDPTLFKIIDKGVCRDKIIEDKIIPSDFRNKFIVIYAGLLSRAQKVENLVKLAKLNVDDLDTIFLIVGDGESRITIEKKILGERNIYLLSYQPRHLMPFIIGSADICCILLNPDSIFRIAFPTKFYEYLATKRPILGICEGEMANIINNHELGLAVPEDKMEDLIPFIKKIKSESLIIMEKNFNNAINDFSIDTLANKLKAILLVELVNNQHYKNK